MIESHVPGSSFPRGFRVSQTLLAGVPTLVLGLALALGAATASPAAAQPAAEGASGEEPLTRLLDWMFQQRSSSPGAVELYRAIRPLAPGESERLPFSGGEPGQVLIVDGFCDDACTDMDIVLYGEDGEEVGADRADDDVPIVEVPAGTYEVEVSMVDCAAPECLYGILIVGADERAAIEAASGDSADGLSGEESLTRLLDWLAQQHGSTRGGVELYRAIRPLAPGGSERLPFSGGEPGQVLIIDGFCDDGCTDMDIVVYGAGGEEVGADCMDDDVPIVEVPAGSYEVEVSMAECGAPECLYGLLIVAADEGTAEEVEGGEALVDSQLDMAGRLFGGEAFGEAERWRGTLAPGGTGTIELPERASGVSAVVIAACDEDCDRLDLVLRDAAGKEVAADREDDSAPIVDAPAEAATADVLMTGCASSECWYGVVLLRSDVPASETGAGAAGGVGSPSGVDMVSSLLDLVARDRAADGAEELRRITGSLAPGASERVAIEGGGSGGPLFLDGVCDESCTDVDLVVYGEDGEEAGADRLDDDVPIVEVPDGSYQVEVSMIECSAPQCGYGVLVSSGTGAPKTGGAIELNDEASATLVSGLLDIIAAERIATGVVELRRFDGSLPARGIERVHVAGGEPGQVLVLDGVCDEGCTDVDLVVYGEGDEEIGADQMGDDVPIVEVPAGSYEVEVRMIECSAPECLYGVVVFAGEEGASEVPVSGEAGTGLAFDRVLDMLRILGEGEGLVEVQRTSGELVAGAGERLEVPEEGRDGRLFVAGVCDQGCTDFDLVLYDADGTALIEDRLDDDSPMVDSPEGGASIGVEMVACENGPCEYSLILMAETDE